MRRIFLIILLFLFLGAGCTDSIIDKIKDVTVWSAKKTGRIIKESGEGYVRNLTDEQKQIINDWLESNDLNRYGDPKGTMYTGGTPLFDETTGETTDRFKYLFGKFPHLKDIVGNYE